MDMRKYASKSIKPDQVRDGPVQTRVVAVFQGDYGRPALELENGSEFTLNEGNTTALMKAWGHNSDDWIGQEIEFRLGTYKDWKSDPPEDKETVKVHAISPAKNPEAQNGSSPASKPLPPSIVATARKSDMDDEIPF